jgi:HlyD family secretion protein
LVKKSKKRWKKRLIKLCLWVLVLALLVGGFMLFVLPGLAAGATSTYDSYTAVVGTIANSLSFDGSISVKNNTTFASTSAATVRQIDVEEEQRVSKGDRLMRLSGGETIEATFDGTVNQMYVEAGDEVDANASLIQIVDFDHLTVTMRVDEYDIGSVYVGQSCMVTVTALGQSFESSIAHINRISASSGSTAYYTVKAEIEVSEGGVLPGMAATVTIPKEEAVDAVILSKSALTFDRNNSAYVMMYDEAGTLVQVPVETGVDNDNYVEIVSGLSAGDVVYTEVEEVESTSGLLSLLNLGGMGGMGGMGTAPQFDSGDSFGGRSSSFDGGNFGGGNFGGGMPGM